MSCKSCKNFVSRPFLPGNALHCTYKSISVNFETSCKLKDYNFCGAAPPRPRDSILWLVPPHISYALSPRLKPPQSKVHLCRSLIQTSFHFYFLHASSFKGAHGYLKPYNIQFCIVTCTHTKCKMNSYATYVGSASFLFNTNQTEFCYPIPIYSYTRFFTKRLN